MQDTVRAFSASQITTWLECRRKWAWQYVAKEPRTQHASAALGVKTHGQLEHYLRDGRPLQYTKEDGTPDISAEIAAVGLEHLPRPGTPGLEIEQAFAFVSPRYGFSYRGFIDWRAPHWPGEIPTVGDHKTTSGLQWAKTEKDLETDVQATLYAYDTMAHYRVPRVRLQWTYLQTRGARRALPVVTEITSSQIAPVFAEIEEVAREIATTLKQVTDKSQILTLPPSPQACEAYGGCPYQHLCNLSPRERLKAVMTQGLGTNSLLDRLKKRNTAVVSLPAEPKTVDTVFGPGVIEPGNEPAPSNTDPLAVPARLDVDGTATGKTVLTAPVVSSGEGTMSAGPATTYVDTETGVRTPLIAPGQINPPEHQGQITVMDREATTKKRGRPKKVIEPVATVSVKTELGAQMLAPAPSTAEHTNKAIAEGLNAGKIPVLYIDCFPLGGDVMLGSNISEQANAKIAAETGKADYRFLDYGQGPGALVRAAGEILDSMPSVPSIVIDSHTQEGAAMLGPFSVRAVQIVRGTR